MPLISDMAKKETLSILGNQVTQVGGKPHGCDSRLVLSPFLVWKPSENHETLSVQNLISYGLEVGGELGQVETRLLC